MEGTRFVVAPTAPSEEPAFTTTRDTGFFSPNSRMTSSFDE